MTDFFRLRERKTTVGTEIRAGVTVYLTMAYILFVNPLILKEAGVPFNACVVGTAVAAGICSIVMGLFANFPLALASGMGLNSLLVYGAVIGHGISWQAGMGLMFLDGLIVLLLVWVGLREAVMDAIPVALRQAIAVGIGLFLAYIGLLNAGIVVIDKASLLPRAGDLGHPGSLTALTGILITGVLVTRRIRGGILLGIGLTTVIALAAGVTQLPSGLQPPDFSAIGALDIPGACRWSLMPFLLGYVIVDFFDTLGTATAVGYQAGLTDKKGRVLNIRRILGVDGFAALMGGVCGASSVTSYIESAAGVSEGGRTGLTAIVTGILFLLSVFVAPMAGVVCKEATAPALIIIGFLMMQHVTEIDFRELETALPAFIIIITLPLTYSISHGIGYGFITYVVFMSAKGKYRRIHPLLYGVALVFALFFIFART